MNLTNPIGVFDSGVGGLSVLREIQKLLPTENFIYVADSRHAPYGEKSEAFIVERSLAITRFFLSQNAKTIVLACNTATAVAVAQLRSAFTLPIVATEPAVKPAAQGTRSGIIGVLATRRTVLSENFIQLVARFSSQVKIITQPCPGLVELIETGNLHGPQTRSLLEKYMRPMITQGIDTLVLGCTHYPFLTALLQEIAGPSVVILNPGDAVAREVRRRLERIDQLERGSLQGKTQFWTSGDPSKVGPVISLLLNTQVEAFTLPDSCETP